MQRFPNTCANCHTYKRRLHSGIGDFSHVKKITVPEKNLTWAFTGTHHHHHHQSLDREGRWSITDDFCFLHFALFSTALWDFASSRAVHSLMLPSHLFLCLPCLLPLFTVPCKVVLARPDEQETWPYHCSLHLFTMARRSSCGPIACWILTLTSSLVTWSLYDMCSILQ